MWGCMLPQTVYAGLEQDNGPSDKLHLFDHQWVSVMVFEAIGNLKSQLGKV